MDSLTLSALPCPAVYVLIDGRRWTEAHRAFDDQVNRLIEAGVALIQLRDKSLSDEDLVAAGRRLSQLTEGTSAAWIMNDRADLAVAAGAAGVHLGQDDLAVDKARQVLNDGQLIGVSTHSIQQARDAVAAGADYIGVGPVFQSQTKQFASFVGVDLVAAVAQEIKIPAFAIGGIHLNNASQIRDAGLQRVAVSAVVNQADAPAAAVKTLLAELSS